MNPLTSTLLWTGLTFSALVACGSDGDDDEPATDSGGGSAGTSGNSAGGTSGTGGASATGGTSGTGGTFDAEQFCTDLCDCVGMNGGDQDACATSCPSNVANGATKEDCEGALRDAEEGVDACVPVCAALPPR